MVGCLVGWLVGFIYTLCLVRGSTWLPFSSSKAKDELS